MDKKVKVFTTPKCTACKPLKELLGKNAIPFEEINVAESMDAQKELVRYSGQLGVPVTVFPMPKGIITGYNLGALREAIARFKRL